MNKVWVAGYTGLVGSALTRTLSAMPNHTPICIPRSRCDLTSYEQVMAVFEQEQPDSLIIAAAKVGGIIANQTLPVPFLLDNLKIQNNLIEGAAKFGVNRVIFLGSSCIYPRNCPQPMREAHLLTGELESTNRPYALAKIAGIELCRSYNRQFGTKFLSVMPTNLYGPGDNYHPEHSHVIPGLLHKFHQAKITGADTVTLWGTGEPMREFMFSDDLADVIAQVLCLDDAKYNELLEQPDGPIINLGSGEEVSIRQLGEMVRAVVGFSGKVCFDHSYPDGTPRKLLDLSLMNKLNLRAPTRLKEGLKIAYKDYQRSLSSQAATV